MNKIFIKSSLLILLVSLVGIAQPKFSSISSMPGAFSRMGFGARGIGMGNAMSAVVEGNLVSYYNPALIVHQENNSFQTSYSFLSLDRSLNFLNFTKRFEFYSKKDSLVENPKPRATAGISVGIINAGVSKIDGRDNQGIKTGDLSTSENQFFLGLANKFSDKFSMGVAVKFYYYKLYEEITSSSVGFDVGALYKLNENWIISAMISDINSKYKWDTAPVYELQGSTTEDKFPILKKAGVSYRNKNLGLIASAEFENSNAETNIIRCGAEYNVIENLFVRGGVDQFNISNTDFPPKLALGFSYFKKFGTIIFGVDYAFAVEQYSPYDRHIVGLSVNF
jgi:opacity protein-like surface antigen